jgi:hypothetical protein
LSSNNQHLTTSEEVQQCVTLLFGIRHNIDKLQAEYNNIFQYLQSIVGYLPRSDNNDFPLCSTFFNSLYYSIPIKSQKEEDDDDEVEEIHVASKK